MKSDTTSHTKNISRKAGGVSLATFVSRICGLVRDQLFAGLIGAGFFADAYFIAYRIPNLLRDLFAEGALSNAFVPTFTEYKFKKSQEEAWKLGNLVMGALLTLVGGITLLGILFAPYVVSLIAPGFHAIPGKHELTTELTRIMFPFLLMVSAAALLMGIHNVQGNFTLPAFAPVAYNLVTISVGLGLWILGVQVKTAVVCWSIGSLLGGFAQWGIQFPSLRKQGWKFVPTLKNWRKEPGLLQIGLLMVPAVIANSGTQVNVFVNTILASLLEQGSPSWLNYAFRLMQLPIGVFGVAISMVTLALVSKDAATDSKDRFKANLTASLNLVFILTLPCAVGLFVLAQPIIQIIFERGAFSSYDTLATASALQFYAIGLPTYAAIKVMAPVFFALKESKVPMMASLSGIAVNIIFNVLVYKSLKHSGLALGTSLGMFVNLGILLGFFQIRHMGLDWKPLLLLISKILVSTTAMAILVVQLHLFLSHRMDGFWGNFFDTLIPIFFGMVFYFFGIAGLGVPEGKLLIQKIWKRN